MTRLPLHGVSVLCMGSGRATTQLAAQVHGLGGSALAAAAFRLHHGDRPNLRRALRDARREAFAAICFTSPAGVQAVADELADLDFRPSESLRARLGSVGPGTTNAMKRLLGLVPDVVPPVSTGDELGRAFPPGLGRVLLPVSDLANDALAARLRERGYTPVRVTAYRNRPVGQLPFEVRAALAIHAVDLVTLTSPSAACVHARLVGVDVPAVTIGPSTSKACTTHGIRVLAEADQHDLVGVLHTVTTLFQAPPSIGSNRCHSS